MKFKYVGPHDAVDIPGVGTVERGHSAEFDADRSAGLLGQSDWEHIPDPERSKAAKKAAATRAKNESEADS